MKDLLIRIILSVLLTVMIISAPFTIYDRFCTPNKVVQEHKIVEAWPSLMMMVILYLSGGEPRGGGGKSPVGKPQKN